MTHNNNGRVGVAFPKGVSFLVTKRLINVVFPQLVGPTIKMLEGDLKENPFSQHDDMTKTQKVTQGYFIHLILFVL